MSLLALLDVSKAYGERVLLDRVNVTIEPGERVGVVGRNGAGKTTLARILSGDEPVDSGARTVRRGVEVAYLSQDPSLDDADTPRGWVTRGLAAWQAAIARHEAASARAGSGSDADLEALHAAAAAVERLGGWDRAHEVVRVLENLGVPDIDRPLGTMSGGQRRRVALARVLVGRPDGMILDEPTNHLDAQSVDWLERYLADEYAGTVVLVTHDRWLLDRVVDRTLEVENGAVHSYDGGYALYLEQKAERFALEERTERNRQNFLRTELEWLRRQPKARTTKQKARIQRAETARGVVPKREDAKVLLSVDVSESGRSVLDLRKLGLRVGDRWLVRGLDLALLGGERLGILGPNGVGKTTLLRAIAGERPADEGEVVLGRRVRIGYLDQSRSGLDPEGTVFDAVADAVPTVDGARVDPRSYLERFAFDSRAQRKKIAGLSGGERARLALARVLASAVSLLLLDEPTNDLDTDTLSALEDFLATFEGALLVITHDRYLLDRVTTGILSFEPPGAPAEVGKVVRYAGAYQAYAAARAEEAQKKAAERAAAREPPAEHRKVRSQGAAAPKPKAAGLSKNEQRELDGLFERIDEAERAAAAIDAELGEPSLWAAGTAAEGEARAAAVQRRLAEARALAAKLTARWEELEAKRATEP